LANAASLRREALLWLIASALSLAAAVLTYTGEREVKWLLLAAAVFLAALGFSRLRRSRSAGV